MKNLKLFIIFMIINLSIVLVILLTLFSSLQIYLIYILLNISYIIIEKFFIYSFILQYKSFLIMSFIKRLKKNLLALYYIVFNFVK